MLGSEIFRKEGVREEYERRVDKGVRGVGEVKDLRASLSSACSRSTWGRVRD